MNFDQPELTQMEDISRLKCRREEDIDLKYGSRMQVGVLKLVRREKLALQVQLTGSSLTRWRWGHCR